MEDVWYFLDGTVSTGPVSASQLREAVIKLPNPETVLVWREGFPAWKTFAESVDEINKESDAAVSEESELKGIAGWLALVALNIILAPFLIGGAFIKLLVDAIPNFEKIPFGLQIFVLLECLANLSLLVIAVVLLAKFFAHKKEAPRWFIGLLVYSLAIQIVDLIAAQAFFGIPSTSSDTRDLTRGAVAAFIWIPYMLKSKRVANTFTK